ncbi:MAG: c-type cytochrome [Steroidobacteraceae bacterium]
MKNRLAFCVLSLLVVPATWSLAAWSKGSATDGAAKAATCLACHGPGGNSGNSEWPSLAGQNAAYIERQLHLLHDGKRTGKAGDASASMMPAMALTLSDQDIQDVAAYYATQTPTGLESDPSYWEAGQKLYRSGDRARGIPACAACHGPVGRGNPAAGYPALRGQQSMYVIKQLSAYSSNVRYTKNAKGASDGGDYAAIMNTIAARLTETDMRDLASYIQGMR